MVVVVTMTWILMTVLGSVLGVFVMLLFPQDYHYIFRAGIAGVDYAPIDGWQVGVGGVVGGGDGECGRVLVAVVVVVLVAVVVVLFVVVVVLFVVVLVVVGI